MCGMCISLPKYKPYGLMNTKNGTLPLIYKYPKTTSTPHRHLHRKWFTTVPVSAKWNRRIIWSTRTHTFALSSPLLIIYLSVDLRLLFEMSPLSLGQQGTIEAHLIKIFHVRNTQSTHYFLSSYSFACGGGLLHAQLIHDTHDYY